MFYLDLAIAFFLISPTICSGLFLLTLWWDEGMMAPYLWPHCHLIGVT